MDLQPGHPHYWRWTMAVGVLAITLFGALVQAGFMVPSFRVSGGGGGWPVGTAGVYNYTVELENESWGAWSVSDAHLTTGHRPLHLRGVGTVRAALLSGWTTGSNLPPGFDPVTHLVVGSGQQFGVGVSLSDQQCSGPSFASLEAMHAYQRTHHDRQVHVPVLLNVATPLGDRTIRETVSFSCRS